MSDSRQFDFSKAVKILDKSNVLGSIESLADQVKHAWESTQDIEFKPTAEIKNVVVAAMGGSALGPDVIKHLFKDQLTVPFEIVNSYSLPKYVDENSLVLLSSYSGNTEEVMTCAKLAQEKKAQITVITAGGELADLVQEHNYPAYIIDPQHNPSNQPRMAIGYAIMGSIGLLAKAGIISVDEDQMLEVITAILQIDEKCRIDVTLENNQAKLLALELIDRRPVLVACEFLSGAVHVATNQFNENAKYFVDYKIVPEINHHLLEGLDLPKSNASSHIFVFIQSSLYDSHNQKRLLLTQQAVENKDIDTLVVELKMTNKFTQVFELITLMAYTNFYLAMLEDINPAPIPIVDWFKDQLKK
jgi:glucose/mannose-6-phosphate isomerase